MRIERNQLFGNTQNWGSVKNYVTAVEFQSTVSKAPSVLPQKGGVSPPPFGGRAGEGFGFWQVAVAA